MNDDLTSGNVIQSSLDSQPAISRGHNFEQILEFDLNAVDYPMCTEDIIMNLEGMVDEKAEEIAFLKDVIVAQFYCMGKIDTEKCALSSSKIMDDDGYLEKKIASDFHGLSLTSLDILNAAVTFHLSAQQSSELTEVEKPYWHNEDKLLEIINLGFMEKIIGNNEKKHTVTGG